MITNMAFSLRGLPLSMFKAVLVVCVNVTVLALSDQRVYVGIAATFTDHGYKNISVESAIACCAVCTQDTSCRSVSYHGNDKVCQLNDKNPKYDDTAITTVASGWASFEVNCRSGWIYYNNACYHITGDFQKYNWSESTCRDHGGHLVDIQDAAEEQFVISLGQGIGSLWIGLNDRAKAGQYLWTSSAPYNYQLIVVGINVNDPDDRCVTLNLATDWHSSQCYANKRGICKELLYM